MKQTKIITRLREQGVEFTWAARIAEMYQGYSCGGQPKWDQRENGQETPDSDSHRSGTPDSPMQYSLSQMFAWTTVVAVMLASLRGLSDDFPTSTDILFGTPLVFMLSLCVMASMIAVLSLPRRGSIVWRCLAVVSVVALAAPWMLQLQGILIAEAIPVAGIGIVSLTLCTAFGFTILRLLGFRLLRASTEASTDYSIVRSAKIA